MKPVRTYVQTCEYKYKIHFSSFTSVASILRPSQGFWGNRENGYLFQTNAMFRVKKGEQRQYWGTGNIRKQIFDLGGTGEQANLFQGDKGTGTSPPGWASILQELFLLFFLNITIINRCFKCV